MNIWRLQPFSTCEEAVAMFGDWREFVLWSDVVTGRRFARTMGLPDYVTDADLHLEGHQDLIAHFQGRSPFPLRGATSK